MAVNRTYYLGSLVTWLSLQHIIWYKFPYISLVGFIQYESYPLGILSISYFILIIYNFNYLLLILHFINTLNSTYFHFFSIEKT